MASHPQSPQSIKNIKAIHLLAQQSFHRRMIVITGKKNWCFSFIESLLTQEYFKQALLVSDKPSILNLNTISAHKLSYHLGSECETLIWDGFSGLNPDGLGIASGLLKGGGLFLLLLPPLDSLQTTPDKDYLRMCSEQDDLASCHTFFLKRLIDQIKSSDDVFLLEEGKAPLNINVEHGNKTNQLVQLPTSDQLDVISMIKKVSFGHRHRPLVIKANRGRGKSSALGLAAAEIYLETRQQMLITAPTRKTCEAAFQHYKSSIESQFFTASEVDSALRAFEFVPIDLIVTDQPACHLLFVDEAAAIPVPILTDLLRQYGRIIFSTTIHGYEGNGQGFAIRFQKTLDSIRPNWKSITLSTPIRWSDNDPLETWFFKFLLLDAELSPRREAAPLQQKTHIEWLEQASLFKDESLLKQIISLLVSAHYQTSPSDLRLILDHPKIKILTVRDSEQVLGVCLLIEEGGFESSELAESIIAGKRRPRGQLFPQALCASTAAPEFLKQTTYRVMRIAVQPDHQHQGLGSMLLRSVMDLARSNTIDSISTSYGLTTELLSFWHKNQFNIVKLGLKIDGASGLQSIMMMHPISDQAQHLYTESVQQFLSHFIFNVNRGYKEINPDIITAIFKTLSKTQLNILPVNNKKLEAFANVLRPYEESDLDIFHFVISKIRESTWGKLLPEHQKLLVIKVLQNREQSFCLKYLNLTGKKQLDLALREAVKTLLSLT